MGYNHQRIKSNAKLFYKNNTGSSILAVLILMGITFGTSMAVGTVTAVFNFALSLPFSGSILSDRRDPSIEGLAALSLLYLVIVLALELVITAAVYVLTMGIMNWYRRSICQKTPLGEIFAVFKRDVLLSNAGTCLLIYLYIFLWSLLFIVPGIIKTYSYSMTIFIKAENPNISPSRAIELSKAMTNGHKAELFYLHLSFIGWFLLSGLTYNILGIVYVFPYFYAAQTFAYEEVKADAFSRGIVNPAELSGNM